MRAIPQAAIDLVKSKETCVLFVYDDGHYPPRKATTQDKIIGTLTGGWGHTGVEVYVGAVVAQVVADSWLVGDLQEAAFRVEGRIGAEIIELLTENQWAALIDFAFNVGASPSWTIWKRLKAKQFDQVPLELAKFVNQTMADGTVVKKSNLVERRNLEIALWAKGEPGTVDDVAPSSATRASITPPTPAEPTTPAKSGTIISGAIASVATVPVAVKQVSDAISPYANKSPFIANTVAILATIAAICVGLTVLYAYLHNRKARN